MIEARVHGSDEESIAGPIVSTREVRSKSMP